MPDGAESRTYSQEEVERLLAEKDARIAAYEAQIAELTEELEKTRATLAERNAEIAALREEIANAVDVIAQVAEAVEPDGTREAHGGRNGLDAEIKRALSESPAALAGHITEAIGDGGWRTGNREDMESRMARADAEGLFGWFGDPAPDISAEEAMGAEKGPEAMVARLSAKLMAVEKELNEANKQIDSLKEMLSAVGGAAQRKRPVEIGSLRLSDFRHRKGPGGLSHYKVEIDRWTKALIDESTSPEGEWAWSVTQAGTERSGQVKTIAEALEKSNATLSDMLGAEREFPSLKEMAEKGERSVPGSQSHIRHADGRYVFEIDIRDGDAAALSQKYASVSPDAKAVFTVGIWDSVSGRQYTSNPEGAASVEQARATAHKRLFEYAANPAIGSVIREQDAYGARSLPPSQRDAEKEGPAFPHPSEFEESNGAWKSSVEVNNALGSQLHEIRIEHNESLGDVSATVETFTATSTELGFLAGGKAGSEEIHHQVFADVEDAYAWAYNIVEDRCADLSRVSGNDAAGAAARRPEHLEKGDFEKIRQAPGRAAGKSNDVPARNGEAAAKTPGGISASNRGRRV